MSLYQARRARFAAGALTGLLAQTTYTESGYPVPRFQDAEEIGLAAKCAVIAADALIAELTKPAETAS